MTEKCIWCVECRCAIPDWPVYAWHADQGHHLMFDTAEQEIVRERT